MTDAPRLCACNCGAVLDSAGSKYATNTCRGRAYRRRARAARDSDAHLATVIQGEAGAEAEQPAPSDPTPAPDASRAATPAPGGPFDVPASTAGTVPGAQAAVETRRAARYRQALAEDGPEAARRFIRLVPLACAQGVHDLVAWPGGSTSCRSCGGVVDPEAGAMTWDDDGATG